MTVACHENLTASDLVGRYRIVGGQTVWLEGPLSAAVRNGAICYLDEIVEARKDTMVLSTWCVTADSSVSDCFLGSS